MSSSITVDELRAGYFALWQGLVLAVVVGLFAYDLICLVFDLVVLKPFHRWMVRRERR